MDAKLKLLCGSNAGETIKIPLGKLLVGRDAVCDLKLDDKGVDRYHCLFVRDKRSLKIRDLNTQSGTYVNGHRVPQRETLLLRHDDVVSVGSIERDTFRVLLGSAAAEAKRAAGERRVDLLPNDSSQLELLDSQAPTTYGEAAPQRAVTVKPALDQSGVLPLLADGSNISIGAAATDQPAALEQLDKGGSTQPVRVTINVLSGPKKGSKFEFSQHSTFLVGRGPWAHLQLSEDSHFSRHHFRIEIHPPDCHLIDLGSRNGTFVNGHRVNSIPLQDGDVITGGKTKIQVAVSTGKVSQSPPRPFSAPSLRQ
jgi:pSer/pThr/pTyr-binding forkhead associated (FHA) protein